MFFVFDLLHLRGTDLLGLPLTDRKARLEKMATRFSAPLMLNQHFAVGLDAFIEQARGLGIEGVVAKRATSLYHPGERSDDWQKKHFKEQGKFVIGGYIPGPQGISELIVGVDESVLDSFPPTASKILSRELSKYPPGSLLFINSINAGLNAFNRRQLHEELKPLRTSKCPFANLPERRRHKHALTADKMSLCIWVKPERRCELAYNEWTPSAHLRHPEFRELIG